MKFCCLFVCPFVITSNAPAQTPTEHALPPGFKPRTVMQLSRIDDAGYKYVYYEDSVTVITLLNVGHTPFRTMTIPAGQWVAPDSLPPIRHDALFPADANAICYAYVPGGFDALRVTRDDGATLFSIDSDMFWHEEPGQKSYVRMSYLEEPSGVKLFVDMSSGKTITYELPRHPPDSVKAPRPHASRLGGMVLGFAQPEPHTIALGSLLGTSVENARLEVVTQAGQVLLTRDVSASHATETLDNRQLIGGPYYVVVRTGNVRGEGSFVVQR